MHVCIVERQPIEVAYLRHLGPYGAPLSKFWQEVAIPWMASNALLGKPRYGIGHDDPAITAPTQCRYDAAVEVERHLSVPGEARMTTIPGGRYAVTAFCGTSAQIGATWNQLLDWLPSSGLQLDVRPFLEHYGTDATFGVKSGIFTCDIEIPVALL